MTPTTKCSSLSEPSSLPRDQGTPVQRPEWSIGIYTGISPWHLAPAVQAHNPVLTRQHVTDVVAAFVADPFMLHVGHTWYMFFEVLNQRADKGEIGLATSTDGFHWHYQRIVLAGPFHLSYPYVFAWQDAYYMVPESYQAGAIRLYQAQPFPTHWTLVATLCRGPYLVDASLWHQNDTWWLLTETNPEVQHDTLRLYYADHLLGPWYEHPQSPIIAGNAHIARPAGRVVRVDDHAIRYTQDCAPIYGTQVRAFVITTLTRTQYAEQPGASQPILAGSGTGWNQAGMHHLDPHRLADGQWLACVDGFRWHEASA